MAKVRRAPCRRARNAQPGLANEIIAVSAADAMAMSRRLAREENLFDGGSAEANVVAALRRAEKLGSERPSYR